MATATAERPTPLADGRPGLRVLVVEDDADFAGILAILLGIYGHEARVAANGPAALKEARERPPDVVLLDIGLPRMDGYEVARRLAELGGEKRPLLIAVTGYGREADRRRSAEAGIDLHLVKPVDPVVLQKVLSRFERILF